MKTLLSVLAFSLGAIALFSAYSNLAVPQHQGEPPLEVVEDTTQMSISDFINYGDKLFHGKGTCLLCHNPVGARAPLLEEVAKIAVSRISETAYKGAAVDGESYLRESMINPSAYVVAGFGKTGTNDQESPMPDVRSPSIGLSDAEVNAVIAYLQNLAGVEVTVRPSSVAATSEAAPRAPLLDGRLIAETFDCVLCHKIEEDDQGEIGPDLRQVAGHLDREALRQAILFPRAQVTAGFDPNLMPDDFSTRLYAGELEVLLDYLGSKR